MVYTSWAFLTWLGGGARNFCAAWWASLDRLARDILRMDDITGRSQHGNCEHSPRRAKELLRNARLVGIHARYAFRCPAMKFNW
jgi:hypothetical protein